MRLPVRPFLFAACLAASGCGEEKPGDAVKAPSENRTEEAPPAEPPPPPPAEPEAPAETAKPLDVSPLAFATLYDCGGEEVAIGVAGDEMALRIEGKIFTLERVPSASGERYEAKEAANTYFWTRGDENLLSVYGVRYPQCVEAETAGPSDNAAFRARGHEPGWTADIDGEKVTLVANYGERRIEGAARVTREDGAAVYALADEDATLRVTDEICADGATGVPHPKTVTLTLDGNTHNGCGGEPAEVLRGEEWVVEDINSGGIIDMSRASLNFGADGALAGRASCNTYTGRYEITGEGIEISLGAVTEKACAPALMLQEQRFLDALAAARSFTVDPTGALILEGGNGQRILARRL